MRNLFLGFSLSLLFAQAVFSDCTDTLVIIKAGAAGYNAGVYDPDAAGALNSIISGCSSDSVITVHIHLDNALSASLKDTIKLANSIKINGRTNKTTQLTTKKRSTNPPTGVIDTLFTFVENNSAAPSLLTVGASNRAVIANIGFARKANNVGIHSVTIGGRGSEIRDCHFWMADNSSQATGALLEITSDSTLVERCLFRAPPGGQGRSTAIHTSGSALKVEVRSNVFFSTGLQLTAGSFHIFANTFVGSRDQFNCIIIGSGVTTPEKAVDIEHNLFAPKSQTLAPIVFSGTVGSPEAILKNAWSHDVANLALAVNATNGTLTLTNATGANANTPLPRGFANYSSVPDIKDYPLTELRSDSTLARNNPDFGKIFQVFTITNWTTIADIKDGLPASKLYFPNGFSPFIPGQAWNKEGLGVKVGAFAAQDNVESPTPLDSGAQGSALTFTPSSDPTKIRYTKMSFDQNYYKMFQQPEFVLYFFSNTLSKLTGSNDSTALKAQVGSSYVKEIFLGNDSTVVVPKDVRTGGAIFVKMLHYRKSWQAPVQAPGGVSAIATVNGVPSFPINDLTIAINPALSDSTNGKVNLTVTHGSEAIDSIQVFAVRDGGSIQDSHTQPATGSSLTFNFTLAKGTYYFYAVPLAKLGAVTKPGAATANTRTIPLGIFVGDTVYVNLKTGACPGADGQKGTAYCGLDSALKAVEVSPKKPSTIVVTNGSPAATMDDLTIGGTDSSALTITCISSGKVVEGRPVFLGKTKEALTITRKNVTVHGFIFELPAGSTGTTALNVKAPGALIDGNIFRAQTKGAVEGPALNVDVGNGDCRFTNNVVWGYTKSVQVTNSPTANVRIINNTFVDESDLSNSGKTVGVAAVGALSATIASNFFSGIASPMDVTVSGKSPTLDANVYTSAKPVLQGLTDIGGLDSADRISRAIDPASGTYMGDMDLALSSSFDCSSIRACQSLYAGSSLGNYSTPITVDYVGRARTGRNDVGAFQLTTATSTVQGRLSVDALRIPGDSNYSKVNFTISTKNLDSASDADSVFVWWYTSPYSPWDAKLPSANQMHFPISKLAATNSMTATITGLEGSTQYYFYAGLEKSGLAVGFGYSDTLTTALNLQPGDWVITSETSVVPPGNGQFVSGGDYNGKFRTKVMFSQPVTSGTVKNPIFERILEPNKYQLDLTSPLPQFTLFHDVPGLGDANSKMTFTDTIAMDFPIDLTGKSLFILPKDANSLPTYVPTWQVIQENGKSKIIIEGSTKGQLIYAFGVVAPSAPPPGKIDTVETSVGLFDFTAAKDSTILHIPMNITGSGFITQNPLVVVSVIPAGGMAPDAVLGGKYHSSSLLLSNGLTALDDSLRKERFYRYYLQAVQGEAASSAPAGQNKPFTMDSVGADVFATATNMNNADLVISGNGDLSQATISIPIAKAFKSAKDGKASRSIEVEFTSFDGSKWSRSRRFIRTHFTEADLTGKDKKGDFVQARWNLYGYPWSEPDTGSLARVVGAQKWDHDSQRLMKYKGTGSTPADFIAYDGTNGSAITFDSSRAIWSGVNAPYDPTCASGTSLDYKPFSMSLKGGVWNDVALPFNFPIKWADVLEASGVASANAWRYLPGSGSTAPSWEALTGKSVVFPWDGMSIKPPADVTLVIPLVDSARSTTPLAKKTAESENAWSARIQGFNSTASMSLLIGKAGGERTFGEAPSVPGQDFRLALNHAGVNGQEPVSSFLQAEQGSWQANWSLQTAVGAGSKGVYLRVTDNAKNVPIYLVEALHKTVKAVGNDSSTFLTQEQLQGNDYHLVAGDSRYLNSVLDGLIPLHMLSLSNYPNPFSGSTLIRYALPESFGKVTFTLKIRDFRGRLVFEKTINTGNALNYVWDGRDNMHLMLPSGVYHLTLDANVPGKPVFKASRRLLKM